MPTDYRAARLAIRERDLDRDHAAQLADDAATMANPYAGDDHPCCPEHAGDNADVCADCQHPHDVAECTVCGCTLRPGRYDPWQD